MSTVSDFIGTLDNGEVLELLAEFHDSKSDTVVMCVRDSLHNLRDCEVEARAYMYAFDDFVEEHPNYKAWIDEKRRESGGIDESLGRLAGATDWEAGE